MVSHHFVSQLVLFARIWLFVVVHLAPPTRAVTAPDAPAAPEPVTLKRHHSNEPTPFEGLPPKPLCALCAQETAPPHAPPEPLPPTPRRPRELDTSRHVCPHAGCEDRGGRGRGNLHANGHPRGGPGRQFHCTACQGDWLETDGTMCHGKHAAVERLVRVVACLAEAWGIRATARVCAVAPHTVGHWLAEAVEQLRAFSAYVLCDLPLEPWPRDEVYAGLPERNAGESSDAEAMKRFERSSGWGWTAMAPQSTLRVGGDSGRRPLALAQRVVHQVPRVVVPGWVPLLLPDGRKEYAPAFLTPFGSWRHPERRQAPGPRPQPRWMPLPEVLSAQVVKAYRRRRIVGVKHRVVFGPRLVIAEVVARGGGTINTACIEGLNRDRRQGEAALGRRGHPLCQGAAG